MLPKATLGLPHRGGKKHRFSVSSAIKNHLLRWRDGDIRQLWLESKSCSKNHNTSPPSSSTNKSINIKKARYKGKEGHYGKAIQALQSQGVAHPSNTSALVDLQSRHPQNPLPTPLSNYPATLSVSPEMILSCLSSFPKGPSPGSSNFRIQHLFEPICGSWAPASRECLRSLTLWLNHLLSGKAHPLLAPWLCGAPLTALHKKCQQGFRPIAVGEIFRRLASKICCQYIKTDLPQFFIPHGQLGVGIKGGLEAIIHSARFIIDKFQTHEDMCLLKLDFKNAFNECNREIMLNEILEHFPELFGWAPWSYCCAGELRFGHHRILSSTGVQQGDPMGPLLFSLVLCKLLREVKENKFSSSNSLFDLWYLDDGTIIGNCVDVAKFYDEVLFQGPSFGLYVNPQKCELFWPSEDQLFRGFNESILRLYDGVSLLGSPLWGTEHFTIKELNVRIDKVKGLQTLILELDDPQVELHLLRSCLNNVCKINHLLRTVPSESILTSYENLMKTSIVKYQMMLGLKLFFHSVTEA